MKKRSSSGVIIVALGLLKIVAMVVKGVREMGKEKGGKQ